MPDYFSDYYFTSNQTNYLCPAFWSFEQCQPPNACARDPQTGKFYCCNSLEIPENVCWSIPEDCAADGSTLTCGHGDQIYCCFYKTEECCRTPGKFNLCWNRARSTISNISEKLLQDTYTSLSAAAPLASSWNFDPAKLVATTTHTGSKSSSTSTSTSQIHSITTAVTSSSPSGDPDPCSTSLSGGGIAGIVVGAVALVAMALGGGVYLLKRHRRRQNPAPDPGVPVPPTPITKPAEAGPGNQVFEVDGVRHLPELQ